MDSQPVEAPKVEELHELNIRAPKSIDKMTAVFVNTSNGNSSEIDMTKSKEADSYKVFCCNADEIVRNIKKDYCDFVISFERTKPLM